MPRLSRPPAWRASAFCLRSSWVRPPMKQASASRTENWKPRSRLAGADQLGPRLGHRLGIGDAVLEGEEAPSWVAARLGPQPLDQHGPLFGQDAAVVVGQARRPTRPSGRTRPWRSGDDAGAPPGRRRCGRAWSSSWPATRRVLQQGVHRRPDAHIAGGLGDAGHHGGRDSSRIAPVVGLAAASATCPSTHDEVEALFGDGRSGLCVLLPTGRSAAARSSASTIQPRRHGRQEDARTPSATRSCGTWASRLLFSRPRLWRAARTSFGAAASCRAEAASSVRWSAACGGRMKTAATKITKASRRRLEGRAGRHAEPVAHQPRRSLGPSAETGARPGWWSRRSRGCSSGRNS